MPSNKGKAEATADWSHELHSESDSTSSAEDSDSNSSDLDGDVLVTQEYLDSLLEKARKNYAGAAKERYAVGEDSVEKDVIVVGAGEEKLPQLNAGIFPRPYFDLERFDGSRFIRDPDTELADQASSSRSAPAPPIPPPELTKTGKPLTKKQKKNLRNKTAGPDWFDLPAPPESDLPRMYREAEALRLRNHLDPKRFYRKDEGEGKGIKGLPKFFAIGTLLPESTPFGKASVDNLPRAHRKRTLVDELVDDAEARRYAKKKFNELQAVRGAKGKHTLKAKQALRSMKW